MDKREDVKLIGEEGTRNDESEDEETGAREMADQVDLKAVHATLKVRPLNPGRGEPRALTWGFSSFAERQAVLDLGSPTRKETGMD